MLRRHLTWVLGLIALGVVLAALLATASLAVTEKQVVRGRVASDIATAFIQLSAQKQRLRSWVAQAQGGGPADVGVRTELLAGVQGTLARLEALTQQAVDLDGSAEAREENLRRRETLALLTRSFAALSQAVEEVRPLPAGSDERLTWDGQTRMFDMADGLDVRRLIAENIARETAAVQRERAAADATLAAVRWLWLGTAAVLATGALAAVLHFGRALRLPLLQLGEGARALLDGRLAHRIPLQAQGEFADVARSMNALATELEQHRTRENAERQVLEDQVAARTRELAEALHSLKTLDAQRRRLFADISHELRTPTTVIRGEAEITLRGADKPPAEYRMALSRIGETARQLGAVIDDLLAMARSDLGKLSLMSEPLDLDELVADVLDQAGGLAERRQVSLLAPPRRSGLHLVQADPLRLRQLLGVLLDNATRYSYPGGQVAVQVQRLAGHGTPQVAVCVSDRGIGIPADELEQVFERHFRSDRARRHAPDGSGLGLGIARALAQAHGGQLTLHSEGGGTQARLVLPLSTQAILAEAAA